LAFKNIQSALNEFARSAGITATAVVPLSALKGWNVVDAAPDAQWCGYQGPTLLQILESLPVTGADRDVAFTFPVQWVEKFSASSDTSQGRRVFWGRVATGQVLPGQTVTIMPSGQTATVAQVLNHVRQATSVASGHSAGIVLDREVDVSRGDWLLTEPADGPQLPRLREINTTLAWMDDEPLVAGRVYWALHGHRWVKAKIKRIVHRLNIHTLAEEEATQLEPNAIGHVEIALQEPLLALPYAQSRVLGALILVDTATHKTSAALMLN
jgi:sulfate adenylyltransferase subunit 1